MKFSFSLSVLLLSVIYCQADEEASSISCTQQALAMRGIIGAYVPECLSDGTFAPTQCHGSIGHCWCSTPEGEEILGTRTGPLQAEHRFDCDRLPKCLKLAHVAQITHRPGQYVPQCMADGSFSLEQCHQSTGHCWCVQSDGTEILGTRRSPHELADSHIDCWNVPKCILEADEARRSNRFGLFVPSCNDDGTYSSQQCHGSTGHCWCVSSEGKEILGTRRHASEEKISCDTIPHCLVAAHTARTSLLIGAYVPQCEWDGSYSSQQCHSSTGYCWCVTSVATKPENVLLSGAVEVIGTRRGPMETKMDCNNVPQCMAAAHAARLAATSSSGLIGVGAYIPQCHADGTFNTRQCHGSTGYCWCVSRQDGSELLGTRRGPVAPPLTDEMCDTPTKCMQAAHNAQVDSFVDHIDENGERSQRPRIGAVVPQCRDVDGSFAPRQCHASSGFCWCVDSEGVKIAGTVEPPTAPQLTCEDDVPPCLLALHVATTHFAGPGAFIPTCDEDGTYASQQCHPSTGMCWCVDDSGVEIEGSRVRAGDNVQFDCAAVPKCLVNRHTALALKQPLIGAYVPQCEADGSFTSTQCHASTGHCWCVDSEGVELLGSRRTASEQRPDCSRPLTQCELDASRARSSGWLGKFVPSCNSDGSYHSKQCHGSTGHCWCVDRQGSEVLGTRSTPTHAVPITEDCDHLHPCLTMAHAQRQRGSSKGAYIPQCDANDGSFANVQCHPSTGYCWCSTHNGEEIPHTRVRGTPTCTNVDRDVDMHVDTDTSTLNVDYTASTLEDDGSKRISLTGSVSELNFANQTFVVVLSVCVALVAIGAAVTGVRYRKKVQQGYSTVLSGAGHM